MAASRFDGIAVCVFDAYGTLFDIAAAADLCRAALGDGPAETLIAMWRRKQLEYSWLRSLMGRHADFRQVTEDSLDWTMAALGVADAALRGRLMQSFLTPKAYPDAVPALQRLRAAGLRTAILSNGTPETLAAACRHSGLEALLDDVLSVEAVAVFKPHPSVYALATQRFRVPPAAVAFMSSNGWDAAGAAAFGFRVAWINRAAAPAERLPAAPAAELPDLAALPGLFGL